MLLLVLFSNRGQIYRRVFMRAMPGPTATGTIPTDLLMETLRGVEHEVGQLVNRLESMERTRRLNQFALALEIVLRKMSARGTKNQVTKVPSNPGTTYGPPSFVDLEDRMCHSRPTIARFLQQHTVSDGFSEAQPTSRGLHDTLGRLVDLLPENFSDNSYASTEKLLPSLEKELGSWNWAPVPELNSRFEVMWIVRVFSGSEEHVVAPVAAKTDPVTGACAPCGAESVVAPDQERLEAITGDQVSARDARDPRSASFRGLALMTLYIHWRHEDLRFAFHKVRTALERARFPS